MHGATAGRYGRLEIQPLGISFRTGVHGRQAGLHAVQTGVNDGQHLPWVRFRSAGFCIKVRASSSGEMTWVLGGSLSALPTSNQ